MQNQKTWFLPSERYKIRKTHKGGKNGDNNHNEIMHNTCSADIRETVSWATWLGNELGVEDAGGEELNAIIA